MSLGGRVGGRASIPAITAGGGRADKPWLHGRLESASSDTIATTEHNSVSATQTPEVIIAAPKRAPPESAPRSIQEAER